jgi:CRISPR/Cas system CSM-associated protein Csm2 small subunit
MGTCIKCGKPTQEEWHEYCEECYRKPPKQQREGRKKGGKRPSRGLPEDYLKEGYFDEKGNLRPELITTHALSIAQTLAGAKMTTAALRRFFGKVRFAQRRLDSTDDFSGVIPEILALKPYVANAVTRRVVPGLFKQFIERNVDLAVKDSKSFREGFVKHFEYVVAFFPRK